MSESYPCQPPKCMPLVTKEKKIAPAGKQKQYHAGVAFAAGEFPPLAQNWRLTPLPPLSQAIVLPKTGPGASNQLQQYDLARKVR